MLQDPPRSPQEPPGSILEPPGVVLGASGIDFGASGVDFGASGIDFGPSGAWFWSHVDFLQLFEVPFLVIFWSFFDVFPWKPFKTYTRAQSTQITNLLFFVLPHGSCDFASCFSMFWKGGFSWFRGVTVCFYYGLSTFASQTHRKSENIRKNEEPYFSVYFGPPKLSLFL